MYSTFSKITTVIKSIIIIPGVWIVPVLPSRVPPQASTLALMLARNPKFDPLEFDNDLNLSFAILLKVSTLDSSDPQRVLLISSKKIELNKMFRTFT